MKFLASCFLIKYKKFIIIIKALLGEVFGVLYNWLHLLLYFLTLSAGKSGLLQPSEEL